MRTSSALLSRRRDHAAMHAFPRLRYEGDPAGSCPRHRGVAAIARSCHRRQRTVDHPTRKTVTVSASPFVTYANRPSGDTATVRGLRPVLTVAVTAPLRASMTET